MTEDPKTPNETREPKPDEPPSVPEPRGHSIHHAHDAVMGALDLVHTAMHKTEDEAVRSLLDKAMSALEFSNAHLHFHIELLKNAKYNGLLLAGIFGAMSIGMAAGAHAATPHQPGPGIAAKVLASLSPETKAKFAEALLQAMPMAAAWLQSQMPKQEPTTDPPPPADAPEST